MARNTQRRVGQSKNLKRGQLKGKNLPDSMKSKILSSGQAVSLVGMDQVELLGFVKKDGKVYSLPVRASISVSLDQPEVRGIHMSRLYRLLRERLQKRPLDKALDEKFLSKILSSQEGLSSELKIGLSFELPLLRDSLVSEEVGHRNYPIRCMARVIDGVSEFELQLQVLYSSTCPSSTALATEEVLKQFESYLTEGSSQSLSGIRERVSEVFQSALPHAQRSLARVSLRSGAPFSLASLIASINSVEGSLKTPVQSLVKREDEQEFARLNGQNQMFCEDAVRRIAQSLEQRQKSLRGQGARGQQKKGFSFSVRVEHFESLHPHNAIAEINQHSPL